VVVIARSCRCFSEVSVCERLGGCSVRYTARYAHVRSLGIGGSALERLAPEPHTTQTPNAEAFPSNANYVGCQVQVPDKL